MWSTRFGPTACVAVPRGARAAPTVVTIPTLLSRMPAASFALRRRLAPSPASTSSKNTKSLEAIVNAHVKKAKTEIPTPTPVQSTPEKSVVPSPPSPSARPPTRLENERKATTPKVPKQPTSAVDIDPAKVVWKTSLRPNSAGVPLWGLVSDIHFQESILGRIQDSLKWMIQTFKANGVRKVFCLGDLINTRQDVNVRELSACMKFFHDLAANFEQIHVLLGNHDMHLKHSRDISSLDALDFFSHMNNTGNTAAVGQKIRLYRENTIVNVDGRDILFMPYHESQSEIIQFISTKTDPNKLSEMVGMGHLSLNGAISSGHDRPSPARYNGNIGPGDFKKLLRTFTGHFHSHQTMPAGGEEKNGSVTYLGSPLQSNFGDLGDTKRGFVLYDPIHNRFEHIQNPYAVQYVEADLNRVLNGEVLPSEVKDKFVQLIRSDIVSAGGKPSSSTTINIHEYNDAKEILIDHLGAKYVRRMATKTIKSMQQSEEEDAVTAASKGDDAVAANAAEDGDEDHELMHERLSDYVYEFLEQADISDYEPDSNKQHSFRKRLEEIGVQVMEEVDTRFASTDGAVFDADIKTITIQNFLGVQGRIVIPFGGMEDGVWFIDGANGAGKSTILEAIAWSQFDSFLRTSMKADFAVNDTVASTLSGEAAECMVRLDFASGFSIERWRHPSSKGPRGKTGVRVYKNGRQLKELEKGEAKESQKALTERLGISFDQFARTVVLSSDTTQNFINSKADQRREIIEELLGLRRFEDYSVEMKAKNKSVATKLLEFDTRLASVEGKNSELTAQLNECDTTLKIQERKIKETQLDVDQKNKALQRATVDATRVADPSHAKDRQPEHEKLQKKAATLDIEADRAKKANAYHSAVRETDNAVAKIDGELQRTKHSYETVDTRIRNFANREKKAGLKETLTGVHSSQQSASQLLSALQISVPTDKIAAGEPVTCPTCTQPLSNPNPVFNKISATNESIEKEVGSLSTQSATVAAMIVEADAKMAAEKHSIAQDMRDQKARDELKVRITQMEADLTATRTQLSTKLDKVAAELGLTTSGLITIGKELDPQRCQQIFNSLSAVNKEIAAFAKRTTEESNTAQRLQELTHAVEKAQTVVSGMQAAADATKQRRKSAENKLAEVVSERKTVETEQQKWRKTDNLYRFWNDAFAKKKDSLRSYVMSKAIGQLNTALAPIIRVLSDDGGLSGGMGHDLGAVLDAQLNVVGTGDSKKELDPKYSVDDSQTGVSYAKRSGGQRRRTDLAIFFGLLQLASERSRYRSQYIILDEIFDSLDRSGQDAVQNWIEHNLTQRLKKVFVITHSRMREASRRTLHVSMTSKGTMIRDSTGVIERYLQQHNNTDSPTDDDADVAMVPSAAAPARRNRRTTASPVLPTSVPIAAQSNYARAHK